MDLKDKIASALSMPQAVQKKMVSMSLDEDLVDQVDRVAREFCRLNSEKGFSRNSIIEDAIKEYVAAATDLLKDKGVDIEADEEQDPRDGHFDLVICPARGEGFQRVFLGDKCWYAVRFADYRIPNIRYLACYRAAPYSGVTHFAKVARIESYQGTNKKIVYFDGDPVALDHKIPLGKMNATAMRIPRYTTLNKLMQADNLCDLLQSGKN